MPSKAETYAIRIQVCEKCYEHYNHSSLIQSKSYHLAKKMPSHNDPNYKNPNFLEEEEEYRKYYDELVNGLEELQAYFFEDPTSSNDELNYQLTHSRMQETVKSPRNQLPMPVFKILKNQPYKYLSKLPDTKISTKRFLNTTTKKITEFPRVDSFEVYFENLLVFSKISFGKWPNVRLIQKIIKCITNYCRSQGPLMENLRPFINDYLDIKSLNPNSSHNPPLYEYLILTSNLEKAEITTEKDEEILIRNLQSLIYGKTKVLTLVNPKHELTTEETLRKRDILPYTFVDHKVKSSTMQGIYMGKDTKVNRSLKPKSHKFAININPIRVKAPQIGIVEKDHSFRVKPKNRPLSSNLGYLRKSPSLINCLTTNRNDLFTLVKMGDIQDNYLQQETKLQSFQFSKTKYEDKELQKLCTIDKKSQNTIKSLGKITKKAKLFVNTEYNPPKPQKKEPLQNQNNDNSIIWTTLDRHSTRSKRNSKNSQINEVEEWQNDDDLKKNSNIIGSSLRNSANSLLKIVPSKKIKRASLFLNQRQSRLLEEQLKNMAQNVQKQEMNENQSQKDNENSKDSKHQRNSRISAVPSSKNSKRSRTYKEDQSSSSSGDNHSIYSRASEDGLNDASKIKVIKHDIEKRRSARESKMSKSSNSTEKKQSNNEIDKNNEVESFAKHKIGQPHHNSLLLQSPNKLSVKSRRKSSFYYSNAKRNSLLEFVNMSQLERDSEKKNKKRSTKRSSRLSLAEGIKSFHQGNLPVPRIQEGVQCNFEHDMLIFESQKIKNSDEPKSPQSYQELYTARETATARDTGRDTFNLSIKESPREDKGISKTLCLQDFGASLESRELRQNILSNTMRSLRASCFNNRISKFSFQNHQSFRQQLYDSREKSQRELVAVFPENKFNHAFIVHKFVQKNFYDVEVKKMFTTSESQKCDLFEFKIHCGEIHQPWKLYSASKKMESENNKLVLFPKIFQQVEGYSTPLAEVVNRLLKFHPISISRLFTNAHGLSPLGQYCIWIYHKLTNQFKPIFINDIVPFYEEQKKQEEEETPEVHRPVYGPMTNENSIWFILLQKALAKVVGSYYTLNETNISEIFSMLTGSPVVNIDHITVKKLQKIFDEKIFFNKKAYVYGLKKMSSTNMRIDRVIGMDYNDNGACSTIAVIEEREGVEEKIDLERMIRNYKEICLVFFNLSFVFNQVAFPKLEKTEDRKSSLITFYIINEEVQEKNEIYLCLGGFAKPQLKSKITIYHEKQQHEYKQLKDLELTDPMSYYNQKYTYQGEIQKTGNYFFETEIKYGKYLCLVEAEYVPGHQYYISTYSSKPITIHDIQHNYTEVDNYQTDPLEKIIAATKLRIKHKKYKQLEPIDEDEPLLHDYPLKIFADRRNSNDDDEVLPYDFSNYKNQKKKKVKSQVFLDDPPPLLSSKWVIAKQFVEDQENLLKQRERNISGLISHIQREQQKQQYARLKRQLQTNEKDVVLKMMSRMGDTQESWKKNNGVVKKFRKQQQELKKKEKKITWGENMNISQTMQTR